MISIRFSAGIPAISINCGYSKANLPIGLQIIGKSFDEKTIIRAAYNYEQNSQNKKRKPVINLPKAKENLA